MDDSSVKEFRAKGERIWKILSKQGLVEKVVIPDDPQMSGKVGYGEAYPAKAMYKFLGYYDSDMNIAFNPSLSFTIDASVCRAYCHVNSYDKDRVWVDSDKGQAYTDRAVKALNAFRKLMEVDFHFDFAIFIDRKYKKAKGMSESSAVAAAVAWALARTIYPGDEITAELVSTLARLASGSGSRSAQLDPALWISYPGMSPYDSHSVKIGNDMPQLHFLAYTDDIAVTTENAHKAVTASPFFEPWVQNKYSWLMNDLEEGFRIPVLLERATQESLYMHSLLYSSGIITNTKGSIEILQKFTEFRKKVRQIYLLQDTGPSIVLASPDRAILAEFSKFAGREGMVTRLAPKPGSTPDNELLKRSLELFDSG